MRSLCTMIFSSFLFHDFPPSCSFFDKCAGGEHKKCWKKANSSSMKKKILKTENFEFSFYRFSTIIELDSFLCCLRHSLRPSHRYHWIQQKGFSFLDGKRCLKSNLIDNRLKIYLNEIFNLNCGCTVFKLFFTNRINIHKNSKFQALKIHFTVNVFTSWFI